MKKLIVSISIFFLCLDCSNQSVDLPEQIKNLENVTVYSSEVEPSLEIELERVQNFGDTKKAIIGSLTDIAVDDAGRLYIADGDRLNIKVYEPDGQFVTTLSREGKGPGEFLDLSEIQIQNNRLFAYDRSQQRVVVFSVDTLDYDFNINLAGNRDQFEELEGAYPDNIYIRKNDNLLMSFSTSNISNGKSEWDLIENTDHFYKLDREGRIISDKLFEMRSSIQVLVPYGARTVGTPVDFMGKLLTAFSDDSHVYLNWSKKLLIKVYSETGEYQRAFYYPHKKVPLNPESASNAGIPKPIIKNMSSIEQPETWPVLHSMILDDENRLWLSTITNDFEVYERLVLEDTGEMLARFIWPRNKQIEEVKNGFLYARETDEETGLQQIIKYRIEME